MEIFGLAAGLIALCIVLYVGAYIYAILQYRRSPYCPRPTIYPRRSPMGIRFVGLILCLIVFATVHLTEQGVIVVGAIAAFCLLSLADRARRSRPGYDRNRRRR